MAGLNNEVLVLFKGAFTEKAKKKDIREKWQHVYFTKKFLDYITRLEAAIIEDNNYLVQEFWLLKENPTPTEYKEHLKAILKQQEKDQSYGVFHKKHLLQILPDNESKVISVEEAKRHSLNKNQIIWSYVISFSDYDLLLKNKVSSLEDHGKYLSPEINKWMYKNNLKMKDLNIFAAANYDTDHPHIHLWIAEKKKTLKYDGKVRYDKRQKFKFADDFAAGILNALSPKKDLSDLYDLVKELREIKKETKQALEEFDLKKLNLDSDLRKAIINFSEVSQKRLDINSKAEIDSARNPKELFESIKNFSQKKNFVSLSLNQEEKDKVIKSESIKTSKFFKYLDEIKKESINSIFKKIASSDLKVKNLIFRFNRQLEKIEDYKDSKDFQVLSYVKNILEKENKEFYYQNRNAVLKKLNLELNLEKPKQIKISKKDDLSRVLKPDQQPVFYFTYYDKEEQEKNNSTFLYWYKKTLRKLS